MTVLLLAAGVAQAGLLDALDDSGRALQLCVDRGAPAEARGAYAEAADVWKVCADEARVNGWSETQVRLADQAALARAFVALEPLRSSDPGKFALGVLEVAARQETRTWLTPTVMDTFHAWVASEAGKSRMADARTVTVYWEQSARAEEGPKRGKVGDPRNEVEARTHALDVLRREVEDLGLRWADPGDAEVDLVVHARFTTRELPPRTSSRMGELPRREVGFRVSSLRFVRFDRTDDGFESRIAAEAATPEVATEEALAGAASDAAARILKHALRATLAAGEK